MGMILKDVEICTNEAHRAGKRCGFTLVELLVVVAIVVVLMAILLPSLSRAREQGRGVVCLSNLRQIGAGVHLYAGSNNDYTPPRGIASYSSSLNPNWPGPPSYPSYVSAVWSDQILLGQYVGVTGGSNVDPTYIGGGVAMRSVYVCPSDQFHQADSLGHVASSYAMGTNFTYAALLKRGYKNLWQMMKINRPGSEMVLVDGFDFTFAPGGFQEPYSFLGSEDAHERDIYDAGSDAQRGAMYQMQADPNSLYNWSKRHVKGGANVLFLDGTARYFRDLKPAYDQKDLMIHVLVE